MDAIIGNSRAVIDELTSEGIAGDKIRLIYNGIESWSDLPDRSEARCRLGLSQETLVAVIVANLIPYKGHADLIEGLARVSQELPHGWRVLCAGRDDGIRSKLEKLVAERGTHKNIEFLGEYPHVATLFAAADFGILSSWEEGLQSSGAR